MEVICVKQIIPVRSHANIARRLALKCPITLASTNANYLATRASKSALFFRLADANASTQLKESIKPTAAITRLAHCLALYAIGFARTLTIFTL